MPSVKESTARLFVLVRTKDISGTSGTGIVAEGVEFSNGTCVLHWLSQMQSIEICDNMHVVEQIHGHEGRTRVEFRPFDPKEVAWAYFQAGFKNMSILAKMQASPDDVKNAFKEIWDDYGNCFGDARNEVG